MNEGASIGMTILLFTSVLLLFSFLLILFIVIHQRKRLTIEIEQERQKITFQAKLMSAIIKAQDDEKSRIGRELHDNINGLMMMAKMTVQNIESSNTVDALNSINDAMTQTRELSHSLAFSTIETYGFEYTINQFVNKLKKNASYSINYKYKISEDPDLDISKQLFRVLQEAIMNINKYAEAKNLNISFEKKDGKIKMFIEDDGKGFDVDERNEGIGLHNMKLRAKTIDAEFFINSVISEGTSISIIV